MSVFTTEFIDGVLKVYEGDRLAILQPFKPTSTGEQIPWNDETEALEYWDSIKDCYGPPYNGTFDDPNHPDYISTSTEVTNDTEQV